MNNTQHMYTLNWLNHTVGKKKGYIICLMFLQAFLGVTSVFSALLFRSLIDRAVGGDRNGFLQVVIGMASLMAVQLVSRALGYFLYEWAHSTLENQFKEQLFSCLLRKSYAAVTAIHSGEWMNRLTSDTAVVTNGILGIIPGLAGLLIRMIGALIAILLLEPMFVVILIPGGVAILLLSYGFRKVLKRMHKQIREADGAVRVFLQERLGNLMIIRAFAMEKETETIAEEKMNFHKSVRIKRNMLSNFCNTGFSLAANGVYLFGAAYCGYGILKGKISYGTMMAVLQLIGQVQSPFANLTGYLPRYYAMTASAERLMEAEAYLDDYDGEAISESEILNFYQEKLESIGLRNAGFTYLAPVENETLENISSPKTVVLTGMDLQVQKGEYVAFTGHSGCGKSTVLKLLMSLYPLDAGERYIAYRKDSRQAEEMLTARWRGLFAYVPQGNQLMSGTIREVIAFGDKEKMKQEDLLNRALKIACADEFVQALENGLDTVLGERGSGLSEGQMQRLAIARAIFSNHPILMLDEATSSLDETTEQKLLENLKAMTDKTVLIVTHRPAVLGICDKQVIMGQENDSGEKSYGAAK